MVIGFGTDALAHDRELLDTLVFLAELNLATDVLLSTENYTNNILHVQYPAMGSLSEKPSRSETRTPSAMWAKSQK